MSNSTLPFTHELFKHNIVTESGSQCTGQFQIPSIYCGCFALTCKRLWRWYCGDNCHMGCDTMWFDW